MVQGTREHSAPDVVCWISRTQHCRMKLVYGHSFSPVRPPLIAEIVDAKFVRGF